MRLVVRLHPDRKGPNHRGSARLRVVLRWPVAVKIYGISPALLAFKINKNTAIAVISACCRWCGSSDVSSLLIVFIMV